MKTFDVRLVKFGLKALKLLSQFPSDSFYSVTIDHFDFQLQGRGNSELINLIKSKGFNQIQSTSFLKFEKGNCSIVFTDFSNDGTPKIRIPT
jgi:hypothetical protein